MTCGGISLSPWPPNFRWAFCRAFKIRFLGGMESNCENNRIYPTQQNPKPPRIGNNSPPDVKWKWPSKSTIRKGRCSNQLTWKIGYSAAGDEANAPQSVTGKEFRFMSYDSFLWWNSVLLVYWFTTALLGEEKLRRWNGAIISRNAQWCCPAAFYLYLLAAINSMVTGR